MTKGATENEPGVFRTVDPTLLYERVKEADQHADYVVVYMHWGIEGVTYLEDYQLTTGNGLIDAGADAVIGDHTHCLQGIDFYQDKPIVYSLGNYWFNGKTMDTMLAELHITGTAADYEVQLQLVPAVQSNCQVTYIEEPSAQDMFYRNMENMSYGISIDENGVVTNTD
ncbi:MAG: CapA family protein [Ruminococcus callidus]|nr:CapA family protein [Ruminococcus callidus]